MVHDELRNEFNNYRTRLKKSFKDGRVIVDGDRFKRVVVGC